MVLIPPEVNMPNQSSADFFHSYSQSQSSTQSLLTLMMTPACNSSRYSSLQLNPVSSPPPFLPLLTTLPACSRTWFLHSLRSFLCWRPFQPTAEPSYLRPHSSLQQNPVSSPPLFLRWWPFQPAAEPGFFGASVPAFAVDIQACSWTQFPSTMFLPLLLISPAMTSHSNLQSPQWMQHP